MAMSPFEMKLSRSHCIVGSVEGHGTEAGGAGLDDDEAGLD